VRPPLFDSHAAYREPVVEVIALAIPVVVVAVAVVVVTLTVTEAVFVVLGWRGQQ